MVFLVPVVLELRKNRFCQNSAHVPKIGRPKYMLDPCIQDDNSAITHIYFVTSYLSLISIGSNGICQNSAPYHVLSRRNGIQH